MCHSFEQTPVPRHLFWIGGSSFLYDRMEVHTFIIYDLSQLTLTEVLDRKLSTMNYA